jgi:hypothetical protein
VKKSPFFFTLFEITSLHYNTCSIIKQSDTVKEIMLRQKDFYKALEGLGGTTQVRASFRQVGDVVEAGFLPDKSGGTCAYTTLDFHRAVSQGCEREWMSVAERAKNGSSLWQVTLGEQGTNFGRRQQIHFTEHDEVVRDELYQRSLPVERRDALNSGTVLASRQERANFECFNPSDLKIPIERLLREDPKASIRLNFNVEEHTKKGVMTYGHSIAICQSRDGETLYVMDPNAGVIATNKEELPQVLDILRSTLYKDYALGHTSLEVQDKFWLDPTHPVTDEDVQGFRQTEVPLLTACTADIYKAFQKKKMDAPVVDCSYDESVFDAEAWDALPTVAVSAAAVAVGAHEYHEHMRALRAPDPQPAVEPDLVASEEDEWHVVNGP